MVETRDSKRRRSETASVENSAVATCEDSEETERTVERPNDRSKTWKPRRSSVKVEDGEAEPLSASASVATAKPVQRRRLAGRLANMMSMPVDIFCEVAHYLAPDDLLRLSRSSKTLRELLISKSSRLIWQNAEEALNLPECPPDLSSPQYASFIFDPFCSLCLKARSFKYYVAYRVRLCQSCSSTTIKSGYDLPSRKAICKMTPKEQEEIYSLVPGLPNPKFQLSKDPAASVFYMPAFKAAFEHYSSLSSAAKKRKFVRERRESIRQIELGTYALESWLKKNKSVKARNSYGGKASRRDAIYRKLKELGYSDSDFYEYNDEKDWKWKTLVEQNRELTEWIWDSIFPQLEETIRLRRAKKHLADVKRRCNKLTNLTKSFIFSDAGNYCFVAAQDLIQLPIAKQVIDSDDPRVDFDDETWNSIKMQVIELSKAWMGNVEAQCASMLLESRRNIGTQGASSGIGEEQRSESSAICRHATSFFITKWDPRPRIEVFDKLLERFRYEFAATMTNYAASFDWSLDSRVDPGPSSLVDALYRSVDVAANTQVDMAALGKSFVCLCCDPILRKLMTWVELVQHFFQEALDFEERETKRRDAITVTNVNDHDETTQHQLAAYTGIVLQSSRVEDTPELEHWITPCTCEKCITNSYAYKRCEECRSLDFYNVFSCQDKVDAHSRGKHPRQS